MKRKEKIHISKFTLLVILGVSKISAANSTQMELPKEIELEIKGLQQLVIPIREINQRVEEAAQKIPEQGFSALLGVTGSGKTTLFNLLLGIPLCAKKGTTIGNPVIIDVLNPDHHPRYEIKEGPIAETTLPNFDGNYCDLPGFNDPRKINGEAPDSAMLSLQELVNAYALNKVFRTISPIRIVATINYTHLTQRMEQFRDFLQHVGTIFQRRPGGFSKSLVLIMTRVPQYLGSNEENSKNLLRSTFETFKSPKNMAHYSAAQLFTLEKLIEIPNNRILFLYEPLDALSQMGSEIDEGGVPLDYASEKRSLEKIIPMAHPLSQIEPQISLSDLAVNRIEAACRIFNAVVEQAVRHIYKNMPSYVNSLILDTANISDLRETFGRMASLFGDLSQRREDYPRSFDNVVRILRLINEDRGILSTLNSIRPFLEFFELTHLPNTIDASIWQVFPDEFVSLLRSFEEAPKTDPDTERNRVLSIKGLLVSTRDILSKIQEKSCSRINVYALHSLFLDDNIQEPSLAIEVWSPYWVVRTQDAVRIDLSGSEGAGYHMQAEDGHDGLTGALGGAGGSFYGKFKQFHGNKRLIINTSGGNGGKGQDGGYGNPGNKIETRSRHSRTFKQRREKGRNFFVPTNVQFEEIYRSGTEGRPGGNGGDAGPGGVISVNNGRQYGYIKAISHNGIPGDGGRGGRHGGSEGKVYKGVYIAEHILPRWTGIKEKFDDNAELIAALKPSDSFMSSVLQNAWWGIGKLTQLGTASALTYVAARTDYRVYLLAAGGIAIGSAYHSSGWEEEVEDLYINKSRHATDGTIGNVFTGGIADEKTTHNGEYYEAYYEEQKEAYTLFSLFVPRI